MYGFWMNSIRSPGTKAGSMIHHEHSNDHFHPIIENLIIFAIILVIVQMLVEDIAVIYHWSQSIQTKLGIAGFIFDLIFSIEFIARSIVSQKRKSFAYYIKHQKGWIDFLSSFPLLLFVSGPTVITYFFGTGDGGAALGFFLILKTAKAIRVARILRLIRVIKLFGKIQNTESVMTNRQVSIISTTSVIALIIVLAICQFMPVVRMGDQSDYLKNRITQLNSILTFNFGYPSHDKLLEYINNDPANSDIIVLKNEKGKVLYRNQNSSDLLWTAYNGGKSIDLILGYTAVMSYHIPEAEHAKLNLVIFFCILGVILFLMFGYSPIFAQQVADPAFVMNKGLSNWEYNFEVKINQNFLNDEIFLLARGFNRNWLPLKSKMLKAKKAKQEEKSVLKMDDIF